tara:strand:- start:216 stop:845 length:630 start_codon:yes stop_codon:yes gene_type:complete
LKNKVITIDGPAGSGKQKIAKYIAKKWGCYHLDSGILYRRLGKEIIKQNVDIKNPKKINKLLIKTRVISSRNHKKLRTESISKVASKIATIKKIREFINNQQRMIVKKELKYRSCVIDGRDIGSVVFKNANIKIYVKVNEKIRSKRRYKQLIDIGEKSIYAEILKEIKLRDKKDKTRKHSPLVIPRGAKVLDNSKSFFYTIKQINQIIK